MSGSNRQDHGHAILTSEVVEMGDSAERRAALDVLGLTDTATASDVTAAYRRLAKVTHPDAAGPTDLDAARRFAALTDAYRRLTAPPQERAERPRPSAAAEGRPVAVRVRRVPTHEPPRPPIVAGPVRITPLPPKRGTP
jgi:hypothetical protein